MNIEESSFSNLNKVLKIKLNKKRLLEKGIQNYENRTIQQ
jgi:hypothetical protein